MLLYFSPVPLRHPALDTKFRIVVPALAQMADIARVAPPVTELDRLPAAFAEATYAPPVNTSDQAEAKIPHHVPLQDAVGEGVEAISWMRVIAHAHASEVFPACGGYKSIPGRICGQSASHDLP